MVKIYCYDAEMQMYMKGFTRLTGVLDGTSTFTRRRNKALMHWQTCPLCNPGIKPPEVRKPHTYLVTFTVDRKKVPDLTKDQFAMIVEKQLSRSTLYEASYAIEHIDTNMHAHCRIQSWQTLSTPNKQWHYMVNNIGRVDQRAVRKDNGIMEYISKESVPKVREQLGDGTFQFV